MRVCIYCGCEKRPGEFSDEHIWPNALGGGHLPSFWRTNDVCARCNSLSGLYVDGAFIKSWSGCAERSRGALEYLALSRPDQAVLPLDYLGHLPDAATEEDEVAELWLGPCGATIVHFRPADPSDHWETYAGGDPRMTRSALTAGRAYMALASCDPFWVAVSLSSFREHFRRADRFVTNTPPGSQWSPLRIPDLRDPVQSRDMQTINGITAAAKAMNAQRVRMALDPDVGNRLLAKLALAAGYKLFGRTYLETEYAGGLRRAFREGDPDKRRLIPIQGTGYLHPHGLGGAEAIMKWPGAWVLLIMAGGGSIGLSVITPSGKAMNILISQDSRAIAGLDAIYREGVVWMTIPTLAEGRGPLKLPDYLAHQLGEWPLQSLHALQARRIAPSALPACT